MRQKKARKMGYSNVFEKEVSDALLREFNDARAKVLHNCYFTWPNGDQSEADLVMVTQRGIFVVECKDYSGYVEGSDDDGVYKWKHVIRKEDGTEKVYMPRNPLFQNHKHIQCMKKNIDCTGIPVFSVVVFSDRCDISRVRFSRPMTTVVNLRNMSGPVFLLGAASPKMLRNDEIQGIYEKLRSVAGRPEDNKEEFVAGIYAKRQKNK